MKILARHKWVLGATITESVDETKPKHKTSYRRFTATIRGFQNWKIFEGYVNEGTSEAVFRSVREIRDKIDAGEEAVFFLKDYFLQADKNCNDEYHKLEKLRKGQ